MYTYFNYFEYNKGFILALLEPQKYFKFELKQGSCSWKDDIS